MGKELLKSQLKMRYKKLKFHTGHPHSPDNLHGVVVLLVVDAHDEHGSVGAGSRDHHPLSSALQVSLKRGNNQARISLHAPE